MNDVKVKSHKKIFFFVIAICLIAGTFFVDMSEKIACQRQLKYFTDKSKEKFDLYVKTDDTTFKVVIPKDSDTTIYIKR